MRYLQPSIRPLSLLLVGVLLLTTAGVVLAQDALAREYSHDPAGRWEGAITLPTGGELTVVVRLAASDDAGWVGTIDIPAQGAFNHPLGGIEVEDSAAGTAVRFAIVAVPGEPTFDGVLTEDGEGLAGTFRQAGQDMTFTLTRSDDEAAASPPEEEIAAGIPGEGLVGEWAGALMVGSVKLRLALHVEAGEEGELSAVLDSLDQGSTIAVASVALEDGRVELQLPSVGASFAGTMRADGSAVDGTWSQAGRSLPLSLFRSAEPATLSRPQDPQPPFPYAAHDIAFESSGIALAGTLVVPEGEGPFPAVVLVSGSGAQDRDELVFGHRPFLVLADHLARHGIASLRYDDRGFGDSGGDHMGSTVDDFTADVRAAVSFLLGRPEVDREAVGIIGHSEGGITGARTAVAVPEVDFLVTLAAPAVPLRDLLSQQTRDLLLAAGTDEAVVAGVLEGQREDLALVADATLPADELAVELRALFEERRDRYGEEALAALQVDEVAVAQNIELATSPWFRSLVRIAPATTYAELEIPVLALFGEKDLQVAAEANAAAFRAALAEAEVRVFPGLNHLMQHAETGRVEEYGEIEETIAPEILDLVVGWIAARAGT